MKSEIMNKSKISKRSQSTEKRIENKFSSNNSPQIKRIEEKNSINR